MDYVRVNLEEPAQFETAGEFISESSWTHAERSIPNYELIIGVNEKVYIREEEKCFEIGPGEILLLFPGRRHGGYKVSGTGVKFYWIHFHFASEPVLLSEEEMVREAEMISLRPQRSWSVQDLYLPQYIRIEHWERINILVNQILHVANSNYWTQPSLNYLLTSLMIEISESVLNGLTFKGNGPKGDVHFTKILEWTRLHAAEALTVAEIAERFNYNKDYLSRLFKQNTSAGPLEFIHSVRIGKAKELLSRTSLSIKEIAAEAGYPDEKYFMRMFKKMANLTPSQFRNAYHKTFMNNE